MRNSVEIVDQSPSLPRRARGAVPRLEFAMRLGA
jgi:hypothetical protein